MSGPRPVKRRRGRRSVSVHGADPVDVHVGSRLRERRIALGITQAALADKLGVTFQQLQKYERGANRLSASALWRAAEAVDVPVTYFFDGLGGGRAAPDGDGLEANVLALTRLMRGLDPDLRGKISALVTVLVREPG